jgi:hypothetical protein
VLVFLVAMVRACNGLDCVRTEIPQVSDHASGDPRKHLRRLRVGSAPLIVPTGRVRRAVMPARCVLHDSPERAALANMTALPRPACRRACHAFWRRPSSMPFQAYFMTTRRLPPSLQV